MAKGTQHVVDERDARQFLEGHRIAVVGASPQKGNFGAVIARALRDHGTDAVVVHPSGVAVDGLPAYRTIGEVPGEIDGVIVVVPASASADVVHACAARGIPRVWLFKGLGSEGALSDEAVAAATDAGIEVIAGACPIMFLEPVSWFHRLHRTARHHRHAVVATGRP